MFTFGDISSISMVSAGELQASRSFKRPIMSSLGLS